MTFIEKVEQAMTLMTEVEEGLFCVDNKEIDLALGMDEPQLDSVKEAVGMLVDYLNAADDKAEVLEMEVEDLLIILNRENAKVAQILEEPADFGASIFNTLNNIGKKLVKSKLEVGVMAELATPIQFVSNYLQITTNQVLLFAIIFRLNCNENHNGVDFKDVSRFLNVDFIDLMLYQRDVDVLVEMRLLDKSHNRNHSKIKLLESRFNIPSSLLDAILLNEPKPERSTEDALDIYQFVSKLSELLERRRSEEFNSGFLFGLVRSLEADNKHLNLVVKLGTMGLEIADRTLFYEMCNDLIISNGGTYLNSTLKDIYSSVSVRLSLLRDLSDQKGRLFELELIELEGADFASDATICLTEQGKDLFLGKDADLFMTKTKVKNLIAVEEIATKNLFFDAALDKQVRFLQKSLEETNFSNLQTRLGESALPKGVAAIFYGAPGTGKTETVYQLAKQTGRAILHVDISQSKSMWFGESEKKIKEIFTNYQKLCKSQALKPILLFNEADAIFGKRKDGNASNLAQTENAMQNIILEEMEKLDGILIATTNLDQNLDAAFERRFLFKVEFTKPTVEAKQKIWQSKLPWLEEAAAQKLAAQYSFSGGEIDNIVRKVAMEEILNDNRPDLTEILSFCEGEKFAKKGGNKLGF